MFPYPKFKRTNHMDTQNKDLYEAPTITVVEMKHEGVICASGDATKNSYTYDNDNAENW